MSHVRAFLAVVLLQISAAQAADESLRAAIDQQLPATGIASRCSDAEYLRRVSLDLTGMTPTADEVRAFLADASPDKRERVVDRLMASPQHARHLATSLDLMLMERRPNQNVSQDEWQAWLLKSVRENKPWNVLVREILSADGDDPALRPAVRFALDRGAEPNLLTRDIGRIFFGRDMQCAQCHDHPLIDDYRQADYHGLLALVAPGYALVRKDGDKQLTLYAEKAGGDLPFESVFVKGTPRRTGPRLIDETALEEPVFLPGEEYQVAPADNVKSVPKFSRRAKLAEQATSGANRAFNENIANRLWAHMFGRGLVHPVDMHHPDNPAVKPELLLLLGERLAAMNFDIRAFLREIALSEVYQRSFDPPADVPAAAPQASAAISQLEQQRPPLEQAATAASDAYSAAAEAWRQAEAAWLPVAGEADAARNQYTEAKKNADAAGQALTTAQAALTAKQDIATPVQQAAAAAQLAAQKLPEDQELAAAAQKFAQRAEQLAAEAAALQKGVEEKTAALKAPTDALTAAKSAVDAALAKATPLNQAMKAAEQTMLAARRQMWLDAAKLEALDNRLETNRRFAQIAERKQAVEVATAAVAARAAEITAAQEQVTQYAPMLAAQESALKTARDTQTTAAGGLNAARAEQAKRTELAVSIAAAFASTEAARQKSPEDAVLVETATKLKERAAAAEAAAAEQQKQVDAAAVAEKTAAEAVAAAQQAFDAAGAEMAKRREAVATAEAAVAAANEQVTAGQAELDASLSKLADRWAAEFTLATLKPLTPEQLCWSIFRATGVYDRYWQAEVAELDKASPLTDEQKQDAATVAARTAEIEQRTYDKLKGNLGSFVQLYAAAPGQPQSDFFATADQALFADNGGAINSWVAPASGNVTERIINQPDPRLAAEELYLAVLNRMPTDAEIGEVTTYLAPRAADRNVAAQELVWGLLNSAEFRFNH